MLRNSNQSSYAHQASGVIAAPSDRPVNAIDGLDGFVTPEPTPKQESRRGWRRRRIRRGKS